MSECEYLRKLCKSGCDNYVCRAFFPERQPLISHRDLPMCKGDEHLDCPRFEEGRTYHQRVMLEKRSLHCKYASNTVCGKPWEWWCKAYPPFLLTPYDVDERGIPKRGEDGEMVFKQTMEDLKDTCFSKDHEVHEACPNYQNGERHREEWRKVKGLNIEETNI